MATTLHPALFGTGAKVQSEVELTFGGINLTNASMTIGNWIMDEDGRRTSAVSSGRAVTGRRRFTASTRFKKLGKGFTTDTVQHNEGTVILIEARGSTGRGILDRSAGVFIRLRNNGPFYLIQAKLPVGNESILGSLLSVFQGRGDILSWEEVKTLDLGVRKSYHEDFMDEDDVADCFDISQVSPEIQPRPELVKQVVNGKVTVKAIQPIPARRMRRTIIEE